MNTSLARCGLTVLLVALAAAGCGDARGPGGSGEGTARLAEAVSLSITLANEVGRLVSAGNGLTRAYYAYDLRGRATAVEHVLDNTPYVFTSTYGFPCSSSACTATTTAANGSVVVASMFPDSEAVTYTFDAGGAAQSIVTTPSGGSAQSVVKRILRNSRGQTVEVDYGDNTSTIHQYNDTADLRLSEIETYPTATPATILGLYTYTYDGNGNIWSVTDYCNEDSTGSCSTSNENTTYSATYTYDSRGELVQAIRGGTTYAYAYDSLGNLTGMEGTTQTYFPSGAGKSRPHALESVGAVSYQYDANGNTTGTTGASYNPAITWNADNMPTTATYDGNTTTKSFRGESMWKKVLVAGSTTTTTYYLPSMRVENGAIRKYFSGFAERDPSDGALKFYHGDQVTSSTLVTDGSATVVHRQAYSPFGRDLVTPPPGSFTPKYQFNFKEKEGDGSGFYDYGARLFDPATGRWLSPDSVVDDGPNRYTYVGNNPVLHTDLTGHQSCDGPAGTCPPPPSPATQPAAQVPDFTVPVPNLYEKVPAGLFSLQETNAMSPQTRDVQGNTTNAYNFVAGYGGTLKFDTIDSFHMSNAWNVVSTMQVPGSPLQQAAAANSENAARYPIGGIQWGGVRTNSAVNGSPSSKVALGQMMDTSGFSLHGITVQPGIYVGPFFNGTNLSAGGKAGVTASVDAASFHFMYTSVEAYSTAAVNVNNARTTETTTGFRTENHFAATYDHAFSSGRHLTMQALGEPGQGNYVGAVQFRW